MSLRRNSNQNTPHTRSMFPDLGPEQKYRRAYPAAPGTGPEGKQCRHCDHLRRRLRYSKCAITGITAGRATDISMWSPACRLFVEVDDNED